MFGRKFQIIASLIDSSKAKFVLSILFSWYYVIVGFSLLATYYFFKGLEKSGLLSKIFNFIKPLLAMTVNVAQYCSEKLPNFKEFIDCAGMY